MPSSSDPQQHPILFANLQNMQAQLDALQTRAESSERVLAEVTKARATCETILSQQAAILKAVVTQAAEIQALKAKVGSALVPEGNPTDALSDMRSRVRRRDDEILLRLEELEGDLADKLTSRDMAPRIEYRQLVRRIRRVVRNSLPPEATLLVVSKGDEELLDLDARRAWHFPQQSPQTPIADGTGGTWAGHDPSGSTAGIVQLEMLRSKGANYLLFPKSALWWLERYADFQRYLNSRYEAVVRQTNTCVIYSLSLRKNSAGAKDLPVWSRLDELFAEFEGRFDSTPAILDWNTGLELASRFPLYSVFSPPEPSTTLPYIDHSVDIVTIASQEPEVVAEARRVACAAVAILSPGKGTASSASELDVAWMIDETESTLPSASIVIPSFNGIHFIEPCVLALFETLPKQCQVEILVVDDASTDDTQARLARLAERDPRLRVLRNETNSGFIDASNRGAAEATGDIVIFLNNDTIPLPGWLPPLLRLLRDQKDAGAVGGKLLFPDGRMQEAGGVVFRDGSGANFGKWDDDPDHPLYNYVREVDYCSGALLATWRSLFLELGGLDTRYRPMYCDDSDFCFQVRAKGLKVYYQPESAIIHIEGGTSGTDEKQGDKRYQVINRGKLIDKWNLAMKRQPINPHCFDRASLPSAGDPRGIR